MARLGWHPRWELRSVCGQAESGGGGAAAAAGGQQLGRHQGAEGGVRKGEGGAGEAASGLVFPSLLGPGLPFLGASSLVPSTWLWWHMLAPLSPVSHRDGVGAAPRWCGVLRLPKLSGCLLVSPQAEVKVLKDRLEIEKQAWEANYVKKEVVARAALLRR